MTKQYDKEFKENAVQYRYDHPELTVKECAKKWACRMIRIADGFRLTRIRVKMRSGVRETILRMRAKGNSPFKTRAARYTGCA